MLDTKKELTTLLKKLGEIDLLEKIDNYTGRFFDEPRYFYYGTKLNTNTKIRLDKNEYYNAEQSLGVGISFRSPYTAILKSLMEALERFSLRTVPKKNISYKALSRREVKDSPFFQSRGKSELPNQIKLGWVEGQDLITNKKILLPAQLVYLESYRRMCPQEPELAPLISTGGAAHFNKDNAILNGVCELIERDAMMTAYLTSQPLSPIQLDTIPFKSVQSILTGCKRYLLDPYIFIIETELSIPVVMTIIHDDTGLGPAITVGGGCSLDLEQAMIHTLEEALSFRYLVRKKMNELKTVSFSIKPKEIKDNTTMQLFWSSKKQVHHLDFWLKQKRIGFSHPQKIVSTVEGMITQCRRKNIPVYALDITPSLLQQLDISVVRMMMPTLQPLYLDRTCPFLNMNRLKYIAREKGVKPFIINPIPHPIP